MAANELTHWGVMGMKWGVHKPEPNSSSSNPRPKNIKTVNNSAASKALLKKLRAKGIDEDSLKQDYYSEQNFFQKHKTEIAISAGVIGTALIFGGAYYLKKNGYLSKPLEIALEENWTKSIDLPAGTIFSRVSSVAETTPRPGGFYAAFKKNDILRYRAGLSAILGESASVSNDYTALTRIKAPSGFKTVEAFKTLATKDSEFAKLVIARQATADMIPVFSAPMGVSKLSEANWQKMLKTQSRVWSVYPDSPETKMFFSHLESKGYNAVIDLNNAGVLAQTPIRTINGSAFRVTASTHLTERDISEAFAFAASDRF